MSKGSLFFGNARGKLGQVVLTTVKGQQIARAWQPKVTNPRTSSQQTQRAKFANTVKFYRRATSNLFKFAFEDKRKTESDYNAFMRHNVDNSIIIKRSSYNNIAFPAIGFNWQMSAGSLGDLNPVTSMGDTTSIRLSTIPLDGNTATDELSVADASMSFMSNFGAIAGDFVTMVTVKSGATDINSEPAQVPKWSIVQFQIDGDNVDDKLLATFNKQAPNSGITIRKVTDNSYFEVSSESTIWFAVILSRITSTGVLVSTSYLIGNGKAVNIVNASENSIYREAALISWDRSSDPILKGSVAKASKL